MRYFNQAVTRSFVLGNGSDLLKARKTIIEKVFQSEPNDDGEFSFTPSEERLLTEFYRWVWLGESDSFAALNLNEGVLIIFRLSRNGVRILRGNKFTYFSSMNIDGLNHYDE